MRKHITILFCLLYFAFKAQVNYVQNPSFEQLDSCSYFNFIYPPTFWDTLRAGGGGGPEIASLCGKAPSLSVPTTGYGSYQVARTGNNYCMYTTYVGVPISEGIIEREYIQNELREKLTQGKTYCVKFYVSLMNECKYGITEIGAYLDDGSISTTHYGVCNVPPQVKSTAGVYLTDTLNWIEVSGTFVANGTEKYLTLGNFKLTSQTTYTVMPPPPPPFNQRHVADYYFDDISVIDVDLPAYAGVDRGLVAGDSTYIGRPREVGIDERCVWYKLPDMVNAIDTAAGLWVKPIETTTYVVRQEICGNIKQDTVVIYKDYVGFKKTQLLNEELKIYPNPANDFLELKITNASNLQEIKKIVVKNCLGEILRDERVILTSDKIAISVQDLSNGMYFIQVIDYSGNSINKRFLIAR